MIFRPYQISDWLCRQHFVNRNSAQNLAFCEMPKIKSTIPCFIRIARDRSALCIYAYDIRNTIHVTGTRKENVEKQRYLKIWTVSSGAVVMSDENRSCFLKSDDDRRARETDLQCFCVSPTNRKLTARWRRDSRRETLKRKRGPSVCSSPCVNENVRGRNANNRITKYNYYLVCDTVNVNARYVHCPRLSAP